MKVSRAGKQTRAFWKRSEKWRKKWMSETPCTPGQREYGQFLRTAERIQGHAQGWLDGIAWARRQKPREEKCICGRKLYVHKSCSICDRDE